MKHNQVPRYFMYAMIAVKFTMIYDKIKQLVAVNYIYLQIMQEQRANLRSVFNLDETVMIDGVPVGQEELLQDMLTKKLLEQNDLNSPDSDLKQKMKPRVGWNYFV